MKRFHCHALSKSALALSIIAVTSLGICTLPTARADEVLISHVNIVSSQQPEVLSDQHVLLRDGRIAQISAQPIKAAADTREIDGRGRFLTPGLMDSHVHVSTAPGLPLAPAGSAKDPVLSGLQADFDRQQPRSYLYHGVTQVLDLANSPEGVAAFEHQPQKPDLFRCGAAPVYNGYPTVFTAPEQRHLFMPDFIFEPKNPDVLPAGVRAEDHTPEAVVARIKASGARCLKMHVEDGFGDRHDWPLPSRETMARLRAATRAAGLVLVAHANATDMQTLAVNADVDVIAHGTWNWNRSERQQGMAGPDKLPASVTALMQRIHEQNIGYQPTLRVLPGMAELFQSGTVNAPAYAHVVPGTLLQWYQTPAAAWFKNMLKAEDGIDDEAGFARAMLGVTNQAMRVTQYLHSLGRPLLLASDTPSAPTYANQPGLNTYQEMQLLAQAGIPLADILRAGTINNARQFNLDADYGTIEVGKIANLLLLNANPLADIKAWDQIESVIVHGDVIARATLSARGGQ